VNGVDLTLIKDYECIPMSTVIAKWDLHNMTTCWD
jgi:hypothetical protein